jgi:hypothetical protein
MGWIFGLDLGKKRDHSALCALEQSVRAELHADVRHYNLHAIERLPLGMPYPDQRQHVIQRLIASGIPHPTLAVDQTGVGQPVVDEFRNHPNFPAHIVPVEITGGTTPRYDEDRYCWIVPKRSLVSVLLTLVEGRRLHMPPGLKYEAALKAELQTFTAKITLAGNETFGSWRESDKDDLVLGLAIACWVAENTPLGWDGSIGMSMGVVAAIPQGVVLTDQHRENEDGSRTLYDPGEWSTEDRWRNIGNWNAAHGGR